MLLTNPLLLTFFNSWGCNIVSPSAFYWRPVGWLAACLLGVCELPRAAGPDMDATHSYGLGAWRELAGHPFFFNILARESSEKNSLWPVRDTICECYATE